MKFTTWSNDGSDTCFLVDERMLLISDSFYTEFFVKAALSHQVEAWISNASFSSITASSS